MFCTLFQRSANKTGNLLFIYGLKVVPLGEGSNSVQFFACFSLKILS